MCSIAEVDFVDELLVFCDECTFADRLTCRADLAGVLTFISEDLHVIDGSFLQLVLLLHERCLTDHLLAWITQVLKEVR